MMTSCWKKPAPENNPTGKQLTATTSSYEKGNKELDKTILDEFSPIWEAGDKLCITDNNSLSHIYRTTESGSSTASFKPTNPTGTDPVPPYTAFYPSDLYVSPTRIMLPPSQKSVTGLLTEAPMYAFSEDEQLTFSNLCGAVRIRLTGPYAKRIYYAILTSDQYLNGTFDLLEPTSTATCPTLSHVSGGAKNAVLVISNPGKGDGSYYIALPAGHYGSLAVFLYTFDHTFCSYSLTEDGPVVIEQNAITSYTIDNPTFHEHEDSLR